MTFFNILPIQIILAFFLLFAATRVFLRFREGTLSFASFLFWIGIWLAAGFALINPQFTSFIAHKIGIQRGTDAVIYFSLVLLFYLIFRNYVALENIKDELNNLASLFTLKNEKKRKKKLNEDSSYN